MSELLDELEDAMVLRLYGVRVVELGGGGRSHVMITSGMGEGVPGLVRVVAVGVARSGCRAVDPFLMLLPGEGQPSDCMQVEGNDELRMWTLPRTAMSVRYDSTPGTIEELLTTHEGGPFDLKLKGGVSATVETEEDGRICVHYSANVALYYRIFGSGWRKVASVSEGGEVCITFDACETIVNNDIFKVELCYTPSNRQLCLKARAGYKGMSITDRWCIRL